MSVSSLSNQSITIQNPTGKRDRNGQPGFSTAVSARCRFERTYRIIKTAEREREPINAVAGIGPGITVENGAKIVYGTDVYKVVSVAEAIGMGGSVHHRELMLQYWSFQ